MQLLGLSLRHAAFGLELAACSFWAWSLRHAAFGHAAFGLEACSMQLGLGACSMQLGLGACSMQLGLALELGLGARAWSLGLELGAWAWSLSRRAARAPRRRPDQRERRSLRVAPRIEKRHD